VTEEPDGSSVAVNTLKIPNDEMLGYLSVTNRTLSGQSLTATLQTMGVASPIVTFPHDFPDCRVLRTRPASVLDRLKRKRKRETRSRCKPYRTETTNFKLNFTAGSESVPEPSTLAGMRLVQVGN
jgi:hypothetical protein